MLISRVAIRTDIMIYVVGGIGRASTEMAAYDSALADANLHNYNLICVSSVIPADESVKIVGSAPDLGSAGDQLTVVEAKVVVSPSHNGSVSAALAWATGSDFGLFYEASGSAPEHVRKEVFEGLDYGCDLRDLEFDNRDSLVITAETEDERYTAAVVLAAYVHIDLI